MIGGHGVWPALKDNNDVPAPDAEFRLVRSDADFRALRPEWDRLYAEALPRNPYLSFEWTEACLAGFWPPGSAFVPTLWQAGRLIGLLPLCLERRRGFRVLRFIADKRANYLGVLRTPAAPWAGSALLGHLNRLASAWDLAFLRRLVEAYNDLGTTEVPPQLRRGTVVGPGSPCLRLGGDWDRFCSTGPPQLRHTRRWVRKFEREGGIVEHRLGSDAVQLMGEIVDVERHSWKHAAGLAHFRSQANRRLATHALGTLGARGEMDVWLARLEGRLIAFVVNFVTPERVMFWQGAYNADYRKYYPGGVLHYHAIRDAWRAGRGEYDFMLGTEEYKGGWTNAEHQQTYLCLYPRTVRGRLAYTALIAPRWYLREFVPAQVVNQRLVTLRQRCRGALDRARAAVGVEV